MVDIIGTEENSVPLSFLASSYGANLTKKVHRRNSSNEQHSGSRAYHPSVLTRINSKNFTTFYCRGPISSK